jgi:hypothetical protein
MYDNNEDEDTNVTTLAIYNIFTKGATCKLLMEKSNCNETKKFWKDMGNEGPDDHQSCHIKVCYRQQS